MRLIIPLFLQQADKMQKANSYEGLYRVVDPGMSLPSIFDATYFYAEGDATQYAIDIWKQNGRLGAPLVHHVMPYKPAKRVDIDFETLRSSPPDLLQKLDIPPPHTVKLYTSTDLLSAGIVQRSVKRHLTPCSSLQ